ncbi:helix-turn-helix transcriptional regulator [Lactiplantibacillus mudanjiangensis]|nr:WYL domain-containing protein [Lactiplantibacillus mudanjiangensis]
MMTNTERVINVLLDLLHGEAMTAETLAAKYQVTSRTIQRDLKSLRDLLAKNDPDYTYRHEGRHYQLTPTNQLQPAAVLAILKILIGSRALGRSELDLMMTDLLALLAPDARDQTKKLCLATLNQYLPVGAGQQDLLPRIQQFADWIATRTTLTFTYQHGTSLGIQDESGLPIGLYFDNFYFYVIMYSDKNPHRIYRLDRFSNLQASTADKFKLDYQRKIDEGRFNNKTYLLHGGNEVTYQFRYWALPQTALDRLPHSRIVSYYPDNSVLIEADSFEQGALMWILSQAEHLQVIAPPSLIEQVKSLYRSALARYQ